MSIDIDIFENNTFVLKPKFYLKGHFKEKAKESAAHDFHQKHIYKAHKLIRALAGPFGKLSFYGSKLRQKPRIALKNFIHVRFECFILASYILRNLQIAFIFDKNFIFDVN